jgi:hypothetical protein
MKVVGFHLRKIHAERSPDFKGGTVNTHIEFTNIEKRKMDVIPNNETLNISFRFSIEYLTDKKKTSEVTFEGDILVSADKEKSKELINSWKKRKLSDEIKMPIFNLILKKCTPRALQIEEEINLPTHLPIPKIVPRTEST